MRILIFVAVLTFMSFTFAQPPIEPGVSHDLAKWRAAHYSGVRYKLDLTLEKMSPVLKGTIEVRVNVRDTATAGRGDTAIVLDWRKIKGFEDRSTISNVSVNGKEVRVTPSGVKTVASRDRALTYEESNEHLIFRDGVIAGENVIKLDFTSPILPSGSAITRYVDKEDGSEYIYSLFVPSDASTAFPVFDQPDLKARFQLRVATDQEWKVVSNTEMDLLSKRDCGDKTPCVATSGFAETKPISTYVFAFAAGPWSKVSVPPAVAGGAAPHTKSTSVNLESRPPATVGGTDSGDLLSTSIYVRKSQAAKFQPHAAEVFRLNREGVNYLEQYFDYKFPFPKYDLILIPEFPFGGMEHGGATFLREDRIIFPQEPTKNDYITRANLIFHEAAHQWFGDTVTMRWFDDLWLKEGFAEFMAYKTLEKVMPEYNAWKVFYERNKQAAYLTDSTKGTTPIYQGIKNLSAAKSAYGNIVYRKAPSFLKQAEFYIGADKFQTAVRAFLKKHEFGNAGWEDLVKEFEVGSDLKLSRWANEWIKQRGLPIYKASGIVDTPSHHAVAITSAGSVDSANLWTQRVKVLQGEPHRGPLSPIIELEYVSRDKPMNLGSMVSHGTLERGFFFFPNYQDYGYGIFLLDDKSRDYILKNIQNEKDEFLRSMMWGALWDSVREGELDPKEYVELVIRVQSAGLRPSAPQKRDESRTLNEEKWHTLSEDETTTATLLNRVATAMTYYVSDKQRDEIAPRLEALLIENMRTAATLGQRITYYRAFLNVASSPAARSTLKDVLNGKFQISGLKLKTKDRFDIVARLLILNEPEALKLLEDLEKTETSDEAKRYAYAARAGIATAENKAKYWNDFTANKVISESWIEGAFGPFNSVRHADLTLPYLERALKELPNHKRNRKIFFVNGWLAAFVGGQRSEEALTIVNRFLAENPNLDRDLRLKVLENVDLIERAVKIRGKFGTR